MKLTMARIVARIGYIAAQNSGEQSNAWAGARAAIRTGPPIQVGPPASLAKIPSVEAPAPFERHCLAGQAVPESTKADAAKSRGFRSTPLASTLCAKTSALLFVSNKIRLPPQARYPFATQADFGCS